MEYKNMEERNISYPCGEWNPGRPARIRRCTGLILKFMLKKQDISM
jgi:hypothetical protein